VLYHAENIVCSEEDAVLEERVIFSLK